MRFKAPFRFQKSTNSSVFFILFSCRVRTASCVASSVRMVLTESEFFKGAGRFSLEF